jgi:hypothetical protein
VDLLLFLYRQFFVQLFTIKQLKTCLARDGFAIDPCALFVFQPPLQLICNIVSVPLLFLELV